MILLPYYENDLDTQYKCRHALNYAVGVSLAFISSIKQVPVPYYNVIRLDYSNMPAAASSSKAMVGTAKNIGPFDLHDVSVYASAHDRNGIQVDSVKSNVMHLIKPGQEARFIALPDSTTAPHIFYYSYIIVRSNMLKIPNIAVRIIFC